MGTPSCDDCWSKAWGQSDPIAAYRALLAVHVDNQPVLDVDGVRVHQGDALALLRTMPDNSVHAVVTDPPYGLADHKPAAVISALTAWANGDRERVPDGKGFMGRAWDAFVPPPAVWDECLRVLKPGGHMLVFAGTRTVDLMGLSIRLAGFELRDSITWLYGSGMPKGINISKAIDKAAGATREVVGINPRAAQQTAKHGTASYGEYGGTPQELTAPATDAARQWDGWNTSLKPSAEPIIVARKPLAERTVATNVLAHGCGGLNVDACRVRPAGQQDEDAYRAKCASVVGLDSNRNGAAYGEWTGRREDSASDQGRWPANVVLDEHMAVELDAQSGISTSSDRPRQNTAAAHNRTSSMGKSSADWTTGGHADTGGASRFFPVFKYQAKAPTKERPKVDGKGWPTVKPLELMRWLVRLVTPPDGGVVLDPFAGSGTTGQAAALEGFGCVLIERDQLAIDLIRKRLTGCDPEPVGEAS